MVAKQLKKWRIWRRLSKANKQHQSQKAQALALLVRQAIQILITKRADQTSSLGLKVEELLPMRTLTPIQVEVFHHLCLPRSLKASRLA